MTTARQIIQLSLEGIGVLGLEDVMSAEDADYYLRQLNTIADKLSAGRADLFKDQLISGTVTGVSLTLGLGSFVSVSSGAEIQGMLADNFPVTPITFEQYRDIFNKNVSGRPLNYSYNGFDTIFLYPMATGNTITIQARADIQQFANLDTDYIFPSGYKSAFIACLSVVAAKSMKMLTKDMKDDERDALKAIESTNIRPLMLDNRGYYKNSTNGNILNGFN
jgi:hypothetical protein